MDARVTVAGLSIAQPLYDLVRDEIAPGTGISSDRVWQGFANILRELTPRNRALLARRDELQARLAVRHELLSRQGRHHQNAGHEPASQERRGFQNRCAVDLHPSKPRSETVRMWRRGWAETRRPGGGFSGSPGPPAGLRVRANVRPGAGGRCAPGSHAGRHAPVGRCPSLCG